MCAQVLHIEGKIHPYQIAIVELDGNFTYTDGGSINSNIILDDPNVSLYCFDDKNRRAIFVETPPEVDLTQAAFYFQTQYEQATRLIAIPYDEVIQLAQTITSPEHLIFIHNIGRSGTTLLSKIFDQLDEVVSWSEPGLYSELTVLRELDGSRDEEISALLDAGTRLLCRPTERKPNATTFAIKPQAWVIEITDLLHKLYPNSHNLYLYRNILTWAASFFRVLTQVGLNIDGPSHPVPGSRGRDIQVQSLFDTLAPEGHSSLIFSEFMMVQVISWFNRYIELYNAGVPFMAVRYEDFSTHKEAVARSILEYCDLAQEDMSSIMQIFGQDSQAGTNFARKQADQSNKDELTESQREKLLAMLQKHDTIHTPDYILPGSLTV